MNTNIYLIQSANNPPSTSLLESHGGDTIEEQYVTTITLEDEKHK